jgi:hypothetical protein
MPLLALSDDELQIVLTAAKPLQAHQRAAFLEEIATELAKHGGVVGPGLVSRLAREIQRRHFDPPIFESSAKAATARRR